MVFTIIIGIDIGTTGCAWGYTQNPNDIEVVSDWETEFHGGPNPIQVPTKLEFGGLTANTKWGYNIPLDRKTWQWFKLLLLEEKDLPPTAADVSHLKDYPRDLKAEKVTVVELVAHYLASIWTHSLAAIERSIGAAAVKRAKLHIVITVPAIWPHYADARMKQAVQQAGILRPTAAGAPTISTVAEPEAAARAVLTRIKPTPVISRGDTIVICDAGGGTVDLISYRVDSTAPFQISECVSGQGRVCGGVFLEDNFVKLIRARIGPAAWDKFSAAAKKEFLESSWEDAIREYFCDDDRVWSASVPDPGLSSAQRTVYHKLTLTREELRGVFKPVFSEIQSLIQDQLAAIAKASRKPPKYVALVGGLGANKYLFTTLKAAFPQTEIIQPTGQSGWTAVCRGAVMHGMAGIKSGKTPDVVVTTRKARYSYGVLFDHEFDPGSFPSAETYWCNIEHGWREGHRMEWILKQGSDMVDGHQCTHKFYRVFRRGDVIDREEDLYICSAVEPPTSKTPEVKMLCSIAWDQSAIELDSLPQLTNGFGETYFRLDFTMKVMITNPSLNIEIFHKGRKMAGKKVRVEFQ